MPHRLRRNVTTTKTTKPNVVLILNDDMGYSDIGCYGGEIETPNLDRLAANGLRFSQFYNTARCSPSRASLLTGLHPHQTGVGILTYDSGPEGYAGNLNQRCVTIPQALKANGYRTYMSGKWHVASSLTKPTDTWPLQRGFDEFYGTIIGAGSFYDPEHADARQRQHRARGASAAASSTPTRSATRRSPTSTSTREEARRTAVLPLRRLHRAALAAARARRGHRQVQGPLRRGLGRAARGAARAAGRRRASSSEHWKLTDRDPTQPPWTEAEHDAQWLLRCMEVYAAQIDRMDQGIGRILAALEENRPARQHAGHLPRRQRRLRRGHPRGRDGRRAGRTS